MQPVVHYGGDTVYGDELPVTLGIAHVKQVVWLDFQPRYVESLRHFGLRAVDGRSGTASSRWPRATTGRQHGVPPRAARRLRALRVVELDGPDPNGMGLFGYDNTPGKDSGNQRLYDHIGGVNALTQEDGYPGYGGVFVESLFGFSEHPGDSRRSSTAPIRCSTRSSIRSAPTAAASGQRRGPGGGRARADRRRAVRAPDGRARADRLRGLGARLDDRRARWPTRSATRSASRTPTAMASTTRATCPTG